MNTYNLSQSVKLVVTGNLLSPPVIVYHKEESEMLADTVCGTVLFLLDTLKECVYKIFLGYTVLFKTLKLCTVFAGK